MAISLLASFNMTGDRLSGPIDFSVSMLEKSFKIPGSVTKMSGITKETFGLKGILIFCSKFRCKVVIETLSFLTSATMILSPYFRLGISDESARLDAMNQ